MFSMFKKSKRHGPIPTSSVLEHTSTLVPTAKATRQCEISRLTLKSNVMFRPSWYLYTEHIIHQSHNTLTHLYLHDIMLSMYDWHAILPSWSFPRLLAFSLGSRLQVAFPDFFRFLLRHPSITVLDLSLCSLIGTVYLPSNAQRRVLPRLDKISASADYLVPLLVAEPHLFPKLRSIVVVDETARGPSHVDNVLELVMRRAAGGEISVTAQ
ncbi:hypothetical protein FA15DRAFT_73765 [Coprinopsis marcescibilis]|uniref:F-box domain-containing protein n=1 Tax=Coprinopsis marcescibilis TaxID=230819 RepID=A0A5C3L837_COPMA|nr:hypothetical protein FA15DRAFT_73765 [Coprinopsis marcescibilis]